MDFGLILKMQKELDSKIVGCRKRDEIDIAISFIAELVEWNEKTDFSHKTWKHKDYTRQDQLEEYVDMLFFLAQLFNKKNKIVNITEFKETIDYKITKARYGDISKEEIFIVLNQEVIRVGYLGGDIKELLSFYIICAEILGYSEEEIENEYKRKHAVNLDRINKKIEDGGWK